MKRIFYLLAITLLLSTCASKRNQIDFEKLIFRTSACFGNCPIYNLQINKDKTLLLYREERRRSSKLSVDANVPKDTSYFIGVVSDEKWQQLLSELEKTDTLNFGNQNCCDAPMKTIIAYYNGKRKYVETMFPPEQGKNLISLLYEICASENLTESEEKFEIEGNSK